MRRVEDGFLRDAAQVELTQDLEGETTFTIEFGLEGPHGLENPRSIHLTRSAALMLFGELHTALVEGIR